MVNIKAVSALVYIDIYIIGELLLVNKGASERNNNLPKNIRLRAAIMKDLRSSSEVQVSTFNHRIQKMH